MKNCENSKIIKFEKITLYFFFISIFINTIYCFNYKKNNI